MISLRSYFAGMFSEIIFLMSKQIPKESEISLSGNKEDFLKEKNVKSILIKFADPK